MSKPDPNEKVLQIIEGNGYGPYEHQITARSAYAELFEHILVTEGMTWGEDSMRASHEAAYRYFGEEYEI